MNRKRDNRNLESGSYYHIYNRGNRKENIAHKAEDYRKYTKYMFRYFKKFSQELIVYCFMPNHFHLIVKINDPKKFPVLMQQFCARCARHYNREYKTVGHLFQDKYKHRKVENTLDLIYLSRYIHRNPINIQSRRKIRLDKYEFSSFREYCTESKKGSINKSDLLTLFLSHVAYHDFVISTKPLDYLLAHRSKVMIMKQAEEAIEAQIGDF